MERCAVAADVWSHVFARASLARCL